MSSFQPLNLVEDDKKELDAQHSRELQTEQAIHLYQQALELHHRGDLKGLYDTYAAAFLLEIVLNHYYEEELLVRGIQNGGDNTANDDLQFLLQNVRRLRYLLFRNRGMLFLDILKRFVDQRAPELPEAAAMPKRPRRLKAKLAARLEASGDNASDGASGDRGLSVTLAISLDEDESGNGAVVIREKSVDQDETNPDDNDTPANSTNPDKPDDIKETSNGVSGKDGDDTMDIDHHDNDNSDDDIVEVTPEPTEAKTDENGDKDADRPDSPAMPIIQPDSVREPTPIEIGSSDEYVTADEQELSLQPKDPEIYSSITEGDYGLIPQLCESPLKEETAEKFHQMFYTVIDDFCIALVYDEGDEELLRTMYDLYAYLREWRLARFALEYILSGPSELDDVMGLIGEDPGAAAALAKLKNYLEKADYSDDNLKRVDNKFYFLDTMKADLKELIARNNRLICRTWVYKPGGGCKVTEDASDVSASFEGIDWTTLVDQFDAATRLALMDDQLVKEKRGKRDAVDLYWLLGAPVERVNLRVIAADDEPEAVEPMEVDTTAPAVVVEEPVVEEPTEVEEQLEPLRALKRLARIGDLGFSAEAPNVPLQPEWFVESTEFFRKLSSLTGIKVGSDVASWVVNVDQLPDFVGGLLKALNHWTSELSGVLLNSHKLATTADRTKLLDVILGFALLKDDASVVIPLLNDEGVASVVNKINEAQMHYVDAKLAMIEYLLGAPVIQYKWSSKLYEVVERWVIQLNSHIYDTLAHFSHDVIVGVYELLVNTYLERKRELVEPAANRKLWVAALESRDLMDRWESKLQQVLDSNTETELYQRFAWARIQRYKCPNIYAPDNAFVLELVVEDLQNAVTRTLVVYPNFALIPSLLPEAVDAEATTLSVLSMFLKILAHDAGELVELLERILMKRTNEDDDPAIDAIRQFLERLLIDMTMLLWGILFGAYGDQGERLETGFAHFAAAVVSYLDDAEARHDPRSVITVIGSLGTTLEQFFKYLLSQQWKLMALAPADVARHMLRLFEWVYMFSIHEEALIYSLRVHSVEAELRKSFAAFKDVLVNLATAVVVFSPDDIQVSMYLTIHDLLGVRHLCLAARGVFLAVGQQLLSGDPLSRLQVAQIIHCRYHYLVAIDGVSPKSHETELSSQKVLDQGTCVELARVILPQCFVRNSLIHPPKHEMRNIVDDFYQVLGKPEFEKSLVLAKNQAMLEWFMDYTRLTPHVLKMAMYCQWEPLDLAPVDDKHSEVLHLGLYYIQAAAMFAQYKIKKKSMQLRIVDLETIIDLLKYDLVYNPTRFESWMLLGQAYGFLVEDDVIWTADKLNTPERKVVTANLQRKLLIAYLMAINLVANCPKPESSLVIGQLTQGLAKEMYLAVKVPMDGMAFKVLEKPQFINTFEKPPEFVAALEKMLAPPKMLLKIIQQLFQLAVQADDQEWENYYYLAKVQKLLDKPTQLVLETIRQGGQLAYEDSQGGGDRIVEPHYQLVVTLYKYVRADKLSIDEAELWLAQDEVVGQVITGIFEAPKPRRGGRRKVKEDKNDEKREIINLDRTQTPEVIELDLSQVSPGGTVTPDKVEPPQDNNDKEEDDDDDDEVMEVDMHEKQASALPAPNGLEKLPSVDSTDNKEDTITSDALVVKNDSNGNNEKELSVSVVKVADVVKNDTPKQAFYRKIVSALKVLEAYDKRNWHHRPKYRQAQVMFEELGDAQGALKPLSLLTSGKLFMNIWKPEFERGGKHFYYTFEYAMLYIQLLTATKDLQLLATLFPRLRKLNSTMINLYTAWDVVCQLYNTVMREAMGFELRDNSYVELWLLRLLLTEVIPKSTKLMEKLKQDGIPKELEEYLVLLSHTFEMRKLNNGFGPTSVIDDSIAMLFLKCWEWFEPESTVAESQEAPKRLAKKELYPVASDLTKQLKPKIDEIKPKVDLNKWVQTQLPLRKAEREDREKREAEARAKAEAEAKIKAEADAKLKAEADAQATTEAKPEANGNPPVATNIIVEVTNTPVKQEGDDQLVSLQALPGAAAPQLPQLNVAEPLSPQPPAKPTVSTTRATKRRSSVAGLDAKRARPESKQSPGGDS